jgi:hypothetical protein
MDPRIAEIRDILTSNYERTSELLASLRPDDLGKRAANGWTVGQLAGHVAWAPSGAVWLSGRLRKGRGANVPGILKFIPAIRNWLEVRKMKNTTPEQLRQLAEDAHNELFAFVNTLEDGELDRGGEIFGMGAQTVYSFLAERVSGHAEEHRGEIRAALR